MLNRQNLLLCVNNKRGAIYEDFLKNVFVVIIYTENPVVVLKACVMCNHCNCYVLH